MTKTDTSPVGAARRDAPAGILKGNLLNATWKLALPTWGAFITHDLMSIVDMFFVGKLGPAAVAAVALSGTIIGIVFMLILGITTGTTALVASAVGRSDRPRAEHVAAQSAVMALMMSALVASLGVPLSGLALQALGAQAEVVAAGAPYLRILTGGSLAMLLTMAFGASLRGAGDAKTPFRAMLLGNAVNVVLDPILIFGWLGAPALGVAGSAWATLIGRCAASVVLVRAFFLGRHHQFHLHVRDIRPVWRTMGQMLRIGVFASGNMLLRNVAGLLLVRLVASFGTAVLAAFGIGLRLQMLVMGPNGGFGMAAAAMVGQNVAVDQARRAEKAGWLAAGNGMLIALSLTLIFWTFTRRLVEIFNDDPAVVDVGVSFLRWFSASFAFMALAFVLAQAMAGAGDTLMPMFITGVALVGVGLPLAYALAHAWQGPQGVWAAMAASHVLAGLLSAAVFRRGRWKAVGARIAAEHAAS